MPGTHKRLALVGCGNMGGALLNGWLTKDLDLDITVIQPEPVNVTLVSQNFTYKPKPEKDETFDVILLAVKPQVLPEIARTYTAHVHDHTLVISIAAGLKLAALKDIFGPEQPAVRIMPNTPAAIGQGISAGIANTAVAADQKKQTASLMQAAGDFVWLEEEDQIDAVTALSGSGPAYVFYMIEAMAQAGMTCGLPEDTAVKLARQTVIGAGALAADQQEIDAATLRKNVTSPGGTTEAALNVLTDGRYQDILSETLQAAKRRSEELSS